MKRIALTLSAILLMAFHMFSQTTRAYTSELLDSEKYTFLDSEVDSTGWNNLMDIPTGRLAHSTTVFDGKIYVFGGLENGYGPFSNSVEVYDPESDTWTTLANMPTARCHLSTSLLDGKIYAIGGWSNPTDRDGLKTVEVYDPISDSWVSGTDMPLPRLEFHSCVFDEKIYVFGGLDATEKGLNRVEVYDPESDAWTTLADMPTGRCAHSSIVKDSLVYVFGGTPGVGPYFDTALNVVEIYNPRTDTWEEGVEMPEGKSSFSATLFHEMLYTFGGCREFPDSSLALFEIFDFSKNKWLTAPDIPTARKFHTGSLIDGKIYVIGGCNTPPSWPGLTGVEVFTIGDRSVTIPDTAFLHALIDEGVDTNKDGQISYAEAELVTELNIYNRAITDMTGIEAFLNLKELTCGENKLNTLDVSGCIALEVLHCNDNQLTSLDVSGCIALEVLHCNDNQLTSLDLSKNIELTSLHCWYNKIENLDVSNNMDLGTLGCDVNQLTSLDVSNNMDIEALFCGDNQLTSLDVSNNTALSYLHCGGNQLTSLDVSSNSALRGLDCAYNQLTSLDVSNNTALSNLHCGENQLTSLDVSNCHSLNTLSIRGMPTLTQVCVIYMPFSNVDTTGSPNVFFTTECSDIEAPYIIAVDSIYQQEYIEATSSEDGVIYLVPENTVAHLGLIRGLCIDSVVVVSNTPANISLSGLDNGIYLLYARDSTGNISEPKTITIMGVGIQQNRADFIRLYPNPTNNLLTIETKYPGLHSIEITSLNGQQILSIKMEGSSQQIDLSSFQKGVYLITIRSKDFVTTRKIIKL